MQRMQLLQPISYMSVVLDLRMAVASGNLVDLVQLLLYECMFLVLMMFVVGIDAIAAFEGTLLIVVSLMQLVSIVNLQLVAMVLSLNFDYDEYFELKGNLGVIIIVVLMRTQLLQLRRLLREVLQEMLRHSCYIYSCNNLQF